MLVPDPEALGAEVSPSEERGPRDPGRVDPREEEEAEAEGEGVEPVGVVREGDQETPVDGQHAQRCDGGDPW